jgi:hypothetical protein
MRITFAKLAFTALCLFAGGNFTSGAESSSIPTSFTADIGGFMGASYRIELHDGALTYKTRDSGYRSPKQETITPTEGQWREFHETLDGLKVWQWRGEYPTNAPSDGTQWSLDITYRHRSVRTHGHNNYPDAAGKPSGKSDPTETFNRYLAAIEKLIGGRKFK